MDKKEERTVSLLIAFLIFLIWLLSILVMKNDIEIKKYHSNKESTENVNSNIYD